MSSNNLDKNSHEEEQASSISEDNNENNSVTEKLAIAKSMKDGGKKEIPQSLNKQDENVPQPEAVTLAAANEQELKKEEISEVSAAEEPEIDRLIESPRASVEGSQEKSEVQPTEKHEEKVKPQEPAAINGKQQDSWNPLADLYSELGTVPLPSEQIKQSANKKLDREIERSLRNKHGSLDKTGFGEIEHRAVANGSNGNGAKTAKPNRAMSQPAEHGNTMVVPASRDVVLTPEEQFALRRMRLNRLIMRKRRHEREANGIGPRLAVVFLVALILVSSLTSGGAGAAYAYYQSQLPLLDGIASHSLFQTTNIYDRNGKLLYELYDHQQDRGRRTYVDYSDISPLLVNATIAAEDRSFWTNGGVDFGGIIRAAVSNVQSGGVVQGASTVTQQLINVMLLQGQKGKLEVKAQEAVLAAGLTQQYPKWKIMEMYLNTVYYGDLNYGVEAAAQDYFGLKPQCTRTSCKRAVSQLTLAQASLLAGLPQGPSLYNPVYNKQMALQRQTYVLQSMVEMGMITPAQKEQALKDTANFKFQSYSDTHKIQAPHFVRYLIDQVLIPLLGAQNVVDGGYNIYTTLDLDLQKMVEKSIYDHLYKAQQDNYLGYYGPLNITNNVNNAAAVVMDPRTGEILAMNGSANYNKNTPQMQGQFNAATSPRQPGSSFKPIVYATAFEMGWYPAMIIPDHKTYYPGNLQPPYYSPQNYDGKYHTGYPMTVRTALANSFNIPAIDAIMYAGIPNVLNMAGRLGLNEVANIPLSKLGPSMALGSAEVSLLDMTGAYATFANKGVRVSPTAILEITDNQGRPLYKYDENKPKGTRAISEGVAFLISSMLSDKSARYREFSPGNPLEMSFPAAAKTGTTDSFRDNWTMGYSPHLAVGVWAGNSDNEIMNNIIGITGAGPIWHDIMDFATKKYKYPPDDFQRPSNVHMGTVSAATGLLPKPGEATVSDWFIDGTMPTVQGSNYYVAPTQGTQCKNGKCRPVQTCRGKRCNN